MLCEKSLRRINNLFGLVHHIQVHYAGTVHTQQTPLSLSRLFNESYTSLPLKIRTPVASLRHGDVFQVWTSAYRVRVHVSVLLFSLRVHHRGKTMPCELGQRGERRVP